MAVNGIGIGSIPKVPLTIDELKQSSQSTGTDFSNYLNSAINQVNDLQLQSEQIANDFAAGKTDNIIEVFNASAKAGLALDLTMEIRNKVLDAYQEIMRMQV